MDQWRDHFHIFCSTTSVAGIPKKKNVPDVWPRPIGSSYRLSTDAALGKKSVCQENIEPIWPVNVSPHFFRSKIIFRFVWKVSTFFFDCTSSAMTKVGCTCLHKCVRRTLMMSAIRRIFFPAKPLVFALILCWPTDSLLLSARIGFGLSVNFIQF